MKTLIKSINYFSLITMAILINCSNDSTENNFSEDQTTPSLSVSTQTLTFSDTEILMFSEPKTLTFSGLDLSDVLNFNDSIEVVNIATNLLLIAAIFQISDSVQVVVLGALRGLQDVNIPTLITFVSYWIIGFPISYFLGKENILGSVGIWIGLLAGLSSASILLYLRFNYLTLKLIKTKEHGLT